MARPQKYDRDDVIEAAKQLFWKQGYKTSSVPDLQDATGLKPGSLYQAFGNKDGLLKEVLDSYAQGTLNCLNELEASSRTISEMVEKFLHRQAEAACGEDANGCLLVNSLLEFHGHDKDLESHVRERLQAIEKRMLAALERGKTNGEFAGNMNCQEKASAIMTSVWGIGVAARVNPDKEHLNSFATTILASLKA